MRLVCHKVLHICRHDFGCPAFLLIMLKRSAITQRLPRITLKLSPMEGSLTAITLTLPAITLTLTPMEQTRSAME